MMDNDDDDDDNDHDHDDDDDDDDDNDDDDEHDHMNHNHDAAAETEVVMVVPLDPSDEVGTFLRSVHTRDAHVLSQSDSAKTTRKRQWILLSHKITKLIWHK